MTHCLVSHFASERVMGLEPMLRPWKGRVLPLHHTRINVGAAGFEPTTFRTQTERAPGLRHAPINA